MRFLQEGGSEKMGWRVGVLEFLLLGCLVCGLLVVGRDAETELNVAVVEKIG